MPGGDRTGPLGQGPMTGRRAGYCTRNNTPEYTNAMPEQGTFGMGRRFFKRGRGFRAGSFQNESAAAPAPQQPSKEERIQALEQQKSAIEEGLKRIENELNELKK